VAALDLLMEKKVATPHGAWTHIPPKFGQANGVDRIPLAAQNP